MVCFTTNFRRNAQQTFTRLANTLSCSRRVPSTVYRLDLYLLEHSFPSDFPRKGQKYFSVSNHSKFSPVRRPDTGQSLADVYLPTMSEPRFPALRGRWNGRVLLKSANSAAVNLLRFQLSREEKKVRNNLGEVILQRRIQVLVCQDSGNDKSTDIRVDRWAPFLIERLIRNPHPGLNHIGATAPEWIGQTIHYDVFNPEVMLMESDEDIISRCKASLENALDNHVLRIPKSIRSREEKLRGPGAVFDLYQNESDIEDTGVVTRTSSSARGSTARADYVPPVRRRHSMLSLDRGDIPMIDASSSSDVVPRRPLLSRPPTTGIPPIRVIVPPPPSRKHGVNFHPLEESSLVTKENHNEKDTQKHRQKQKSQKKNNSTQEKPREVSRNQAPKSKDAISTEEARLLGGDPRIYDIRSSESLERDQYRTRLLPSSSHDLGMRTKGLAKKNTLQHSS